MLYVEALAYWVVDDQSQKLVLYHRQATDQLAELVRKDGSDLMKQALKQGVLDPAQCCRCPTHKFAWIHIFLYTYPM